MVKVKILHLLYHHLRSAQARASEAGEGVCRESDTPTIYLFVFLRTPLMELTAFP